MEQRKRQPIEEKEYVPKPMDPAIAEHVRQLRQAPDAREIARRTKVVQEQLRLRDELPDVDISIYEILRRAREEDDRALDV